MNPDPTRRAIRQYGRIVKILIAGAQHIREAAFRRLENMEIVGVTKRRDVGLAEKDEL